jgi:hypothetical protein
MAEELGMLHEANHLNRRALMRLLGVAGLGCLANPGNAATLFDGKTLNGWLQIENNATSVSAGAITDGAALASKLANGADAMSVFLRSGMDASLKADLAAYSPSAENAKAVISALVKYFNQTIDGASFPEAAHAGNLPHGRQMARLNKVALEEAYPAELQKSVSTGWTVKSGAMASTGVGRGVIYTANDYSRYRLMFTMRHVSGDPDHQACVLVFCSRPQADEKPLDALGGIQFQVPNGGHWDYRPGKNNSGGDEFVPVNKTKFDVHEWSRVEIVANAAKGIARMAVAQPLGSKAVEVLDFHDATAGKIGPIAWQMHNAGLFDEYKDVSIQLDPKDDELISVR